MKSGCTGSLAATVAALAIALASQLDDDQLEVAVAVFVQMSDTLATVGIERARKKKMLGDKTDTPESGARRQSL